MNAPSDWIMAFAFCRAVLRNDPAFNGLAERNGAIRYAKNYPKPALAQVAAPGDIVCVAPMSRDGDPLYVRKAP
jgi:hypothetical protein